MRKKFLKLYYRSTLKRKKTGHHHNWIWLGVALIWLILIGFIVTVPPQFWWQRLILLLLLFLCLMTTIRASTRSWILAVILAGVISLLPILRLAALLTWPIGVLIGLIFFLLIANFILR